MSPIPGQQPRQTGLQDLLEPGETEPRLRAFLSNYDGDFSDGVIIPPLKDRNCNLCGIPKDPSEDIFSDEEDYFVVGAKTKKGHEVRNMMVAREGRRFPSDEELGTYAADALEDLVYETFDQYSGNGPVVVYSGMNTFSHPHVIASDLEPDGTEAAKLSEVNNYLVFDDPDDLTDPSYESYGDVVGEAFLERFYRCAVNDL